MDRIQWGLVCCMLIGLVFMAKKAARNSQLADNKEMAERLVKFNPSLERQYIKFLMDDQISDEELKILMDKSGVNDE